jgi:hypothetical protein
MLVELIAIILIIVLSYVLCMNKNKINCQASHIVLGLSVIIFYKVLYYFNLRSNINSYENKLLGTKENFEQLPDSLNSFIMGEEVNRPSTSAFGTMSNASSQQYISKLDSLVNAIESLRKDAQSTTNNLQSSNNSTIDRLNLESLQQFQNFQIQYLQNQINKTKELINSQQMTEISKKYKPIKVYSSCIVSNADGSTSADMPVQKLPGSSDSMMGTSSSTQQMLTSMSQSSVPGQGPSLLRPTKASINLAGSTGAIGNLLNAALASSGINVNVK